MYGILEKILDSDLLLFSFPLHSYGMPAPLKNLIDRIWGDPQPTAKYQHSTAVPGVFPFCRKFQLYAQLRSWHLPDARLWNCSAVEGQGTVCRAGCHLCGNPRQRTLPVVRDALQPCLHELYDRTFGILGGKKPLVAAIPSGRAMECFSGKNQDATPFDGSAAAVVHRMHGNSLSLASDAAADASSFCWLLYAAYGIGWSVPRC